MFMFKKKAKTVSTSTKLQKEAKKFQNAVSEINANYKPSQVDYALVEGVAKKYGIGTSFVAESFETYLRNNALSAIRSIKASNDYSILNLEQAAAVYGFGLDDLQVTYFSKE